MNHAQALDVLNRVEALLDKGADLYPCTYGHLGCTYREHGPCSDEAGHTVDAHANTDQHGTPVRPTLSLNAQETRDLTALVTLLHAHVQGGADSISFGALLGDDDVWTLRQEIQKWAARLDLAPGTTLR